MSIAPEARKRPLIVGLLGGVGSGKSTVAGRLAERGALVLDADALARAVLEEPGVAGQLERELGRDILSPDGGIDRKRMAARVFGEQGAGDRRRLEAVVHPRVRARIEAALAELDAGPSRPPLVVLDVPLLVESSLAARCDRLVFVETPLALRRRLAREGRGWPEGELERREAAQADLDLKRERAHRVIRNDGTLSDLGQRADALFDILAGHSPPQPDGDGPSSSARDPRP